LYRRLPPAVGDAMTVLRPWRSRRRRLLLLGLRLRDLTTRYRRLPPAVGDTMTVGPACAIVKELIRKNTTTAIPVSHLLLVSTWFIVCPSLRDSGRKPEITSAGLHETYIEAREVARGFRSLFPGVARLLSPGWIRLRQTKYRASAELDNVAFAGYLSFGENRGRNRGKEWQR